MKQEHQDELAVQGPEAILRSLIRARSAARLDVRAWRARAPQLTAALRALTPEQGRRLAAELWAHPNREGRDKTARFLALLNASVPGALADLSAELAAARQLWPGWLYLGAPAATVETLLRLLDDPACEERNLLLLALAWVGAEDGDDARVRERFDAWRALPPPWRTDLYLAPHEYAAQAGWELTPAGGRRQLYHTACYELVPVDEPEGSPSAHAAAVATPHEASCGWCGRRLVTLLEVDLRDPLCAFLAADAGNAPGHAASTGTTGTTGTRLRVAHCPWCSMYATLYTDIDLHGGSVWSAANADKPRILEQVGDGAGEDLPGPLPRRLALGAARRTPFEVLGRFMLDVPGISQLGGHPEWIQDAEYPVCPDCRRRMVCVGQVSWEDIDEFAEGSTYAFLCARCGKAATTYQQT